jgi:hypothetical protein
MFPSISITTTDKSTKPIGIMHQDMIAHKAAVHQPTIDHVAGFDRLVRLLGLRLAPMVGIAVLLCQATVIASRWYAWRRTYLV